jgi:two-component system chemotaxis response regulator CheB
VRVLVVDDTASHRLTVANALREIPGVVEVDTASSGEEALGAVIKKPYDLVTLDVEMPGMDGYAVLRWLMANRPRPVLIISDRRHDRSALGALELGAFEVLGKPSSRSGGLTEWKRLLHEAVVEAAQLRVDLLAERARHAEEDPAHAHRRRPTPGALRSPSASGPPTALVVAASTGGPPALREIFSSLLERSAMVAVAQHMPASFTRSLASRLKAETGWDTHEASEGTAARGGSVYIAPGGRHLTLRRTEAGKVVFAVTPPTSPQAWCPSADLLFASAASLYGPRLVAVVLTGMGDDGAAGVRAVANAGGTVICEGAETAVVPGMPEAAARAVPGAIRLPLPQIGPEIDRVLRNLA